MSNQDSSQPSRGILYIAFGEQWLAEARRSIASLRKVSDVAVAVVTDTPWTEEPQPDQFVVRERVDGWASKPAHMYEASPFKLTLFIDTDTVIMKDPAPAFGLLKHYDIGVRFGGPQLNEGPDLLLHTQCNSGVVLFKSSEVVSDVFAIWQHEYRTARERQTSSLDPGRGLNDQRYLSIAIAKSKARPVHLAEYLNFTLFDTISTSSPPFVIHGRHKHMELVGAEISKNWDTKTDWQPRLWLPNIAGILPRGVRRSDPLLATALVLRRLWNDLRRAIRKKY